MKAGPRDRKITVESKSTSGEDAFGDPTESWASSGQFWAAMYYGSGQERREAGIEGADRVATFEIDYGVAALAISVADRIIDDYDGVWDVTRTAEDRSQGIVMLEAKERTSQ